MTVDNLLSEGIVALDAKRMRFRARILKRRTNWRPTIRGPATFLLSPPKRSSRMTSYPHPWSAAPRGGYFPGMQCSSTTSAIVSLERAQQSESGLPQTYYVI